MVILRRGRGVDCVMSTWLMTPIVRQSPPNRLCARQKCRMRPVQCNECTRPRQPSPSVHRGEVGQLRAGASITQLLWRLWWCVKGVQRLRAQATRVCSECGLPAVRRCGHMSRAAEVDGSRIFVRLCDVCPVARACRDVDGKGSVRVVALGGSGQGRGRGGI